MLTVLGARYHLQPTQPTLNTTIFVSLGGVYFDFFDPALHNLILKTLSQPRHLGNKIRFYGFSRLVEALS